MWQATVYRGGGEGIGVKLRNDYSQKPLFYEKLRVDFSYLSLSSSKTCFVWLYCLLQYSASSVRNKILVVVEEKQRNSISSVGTK